MLITKKVKALACTTTLGLQETENLRSLQGYQPYAPAAFTPGIRFSLKLSRLQGRCSTERIMSTKNRNDPIGNRTRILQFVAQGPN